MHDDMFTGKRTERLETYVTPSALVVLHKAADKGGYKLSTYLAWVLSNHAQSVAQLVSDEQPNSQPLTTTKHGGTQ